MVRGGDSRRDGELVRQFHCAEDHANVIRPSAGPSADPLQIYDCRHGLNIITKGEEAKSAEYEEAKARS